MRRYVLLFRCRLSQTEPGQRLVAKSDDLPVAAEHCVTGGSSSSAVLPGLPAVRSQGKRAFSVDKNPPGTRRRELPTIRAGEMGRDFLRGRGVREVRRRDQIVLHEVCPDLPGRRRCGRTHNRRGFRHSGIDNAIGLFDADNRRGKIVAHPAPASGCGFCLLSGDSKLTNAGKTHRGVLEP